MRSIRICPAWCSRYDCRLNCYYAAVSVALKRFELRARKEPDLQRKRERLIRLLNVET